MVLISQTGIATLRIVLRYEKKLSFVEQPMAPTPNPKTADQETIDKYYESVNVEQEVACLMLSSMSPYLQRTLENFNAYDMLKELKTCSKSRQNRNCLKQLKHSMLANKRMVNCLILNSLNKDYEQFVQNYNMHSMGKTIAELHDMLKLHEKGIPKKAATPYVLAIKEGKIQKDKKKPHWAKGKDKGKTKLAYAPKPKIPPPPKRDNPAKDSICHHYKEVGHWMRNCPTYHAELKKRKNASGASTLGNRMRAAVEAIGSFDLFLPNGLVIVLDNCHYAPSITRSSFWGYALEYVARILNMVPTKKVDKTPYEIWNGNAPNLSYLKVWDCEALMKQDTPDKLEPITVKCIFKEDDMQPSNDTSEQHYEVEPHGVEVPIRRFERISQAHDIYGFYVDAEEHGLGDLNEPPNYKAALSEPESNKLLDAMNAEMQSMKDNQV
ncbi:zinc finger, CCHC-type containing protein [Tanacetum coccineum]